MKIFAALLLSIFSLAGIATSQTYQPNGEVDVVRLNGNIYLLRANAKKGNPDLAASIGSDGVLLVDSGFASTGSKVAAKVKGLGGSRVRIIVNTHWHGDHTSGNETFGPEAIIIARSSLRKRLLTQGIIEDNDRLIAKQGLPSIGFDSDFSIYFNGEEVRVVALPSGHTDGDALVYFTGANVLCVGDYFFVNRFPVIDIEDSGADLEGYLKNIKFIIEKYPGNATIVPGHAGFFPVELKTFAMDDLKAYYEVLLESIEVIRQKMKSGQSLAQIQKEGLPAKFASYSERPRFVSAENWIETVYKTYVKK